MCEATRAPSSMTSGMDGLMRLRLGGVACPWSQGLRLRPAGTGRG